jgi:hypothetical protein
LSGGVERSRLFELSNGGLRFGIFVSTKPLEKKSLLYPRGGDPAVGGVVTGSTGQVGPVLPAVVDVAIRDGGDERYLRPGLDGAFGSGTGGHAKAPGKSL